MKKALAILILVSMCMAWGSSFCEGWKAGYRAGYCYGQYACIAPIAPVCPVPRVGENGYSDGYNRGFLRGLNDR